MKKFFINDEIKAKFLKVIDNEGKILGNMEKSQALKLANDNNLDLVLINIDPPVAKILNYSKLKYEMEKKEKELKKKNRLQKNVLKEVNIRISTGEWDLNRIRKRIEEWLEEGYKVKVNMLIKGREIKYKTTAIDALKLFVSSIKNCKAETDFKNTQKGLCVILVHQTDKKGTLCSANR